MKPLFFTALSTVVALAGISATAVAVNSQDKLNPDLLQQRVDELSATAGAPVIAEVRDGDETWTGAAGTREKGGDQAAEPTDYARVGSVTKTMTTAVVMELIEDGEFDLETELSEVLPAAPDYPEPITVRQLLDHTTGIPDYLNQIYSSLAYASLADLKNNRLDEYTPEQLLETAGTTLQFSPGSEWSYSNTNYILLGMIIEEHTGGQFEEELTARVFEPVGMDASYIPTTDTGLESPFLHAYFRHKLGLDHTLDTTEFSPTQMRAAGAVISQPADINAFYRALFNGELISPDSLEQMRQFTELSEGAYGMGLQAMPVGEECAPIPDGVAQGHTGGTLGHNTFSFHSPDGNRQMTFMLGVDVQSVRLWHHHNVVAGIEALQTAGLCDTGEAPDGFEPKVTNLDPGLSES